MAKPSGSVKLEFLDAKGTVLRTFTSPDSTKPKPDSIVSQFLQAIRPSKPVLHPENVNSIVDEALRFLAPEIADRDIVVEAELRPDLP